MKEWQEQREPAVEERSGRARPAGWPLVPLLPVVAGGLWLWCAARGGLPGMLAGGLPGSLLLATGLSNLLWSGNARIFQFMTLGASMGVAFSLPALPAFGVLAALCMLVLSAACFVAAGYLSIWQEPVPESIPEPQMRPSVAVRAAEDELSMCGIVLTTWPLITGRKAERVGREVREALPLFAERGWLADPASYHRTPPAIERLDRGGTVHSAVNFSHVTFESGYEPWPEEPGRERWLSYAPNRRAHAWLLRHPGEPRPWMVCLPGIRMGSPRLDLPLFRPGYLHHELGLNLLIPVLPIHGPRKVGLVSGDRILSGDVMDTLHTASQAMWDTRRLLLWLREREDAPAIGVVGHSLGGYASALLCCLDGGVGCVIAGNPAVNASRLFWRSALSPTARYLRNAGVTERSMGALLRAASPLALAPRTDHAHRAIFAATADRVVPPIEALTLWRHWEEPRIAWYGGTHRAFLGTRQARVLVKQTLQAAGMIPQEI